MGKIDHSKDLHHRFVKRSFDSSPPVSSSAISAASSTSESAKIHDSSISAPDKKLTRKIDHDKSQSSSSNQDVNTHINSPGIRR